MVAAFPERAPKNTRWFIRRLQDVSPGNLRALWLPHSTDTTTNILKPDGRTWTNSATIQGRVSYQGNGILVSFNGTDQRVTAVDADDLSFGNGTADSPFSIVALANVTNTAAARSMVTKYGSTSQEYEFIVTSSDTLLLHFGDPSAAAFPYTISNAAITQGSPTLFGCTYTAASGGATAMNDVTLYQNASALAVTRANEAGYVAMENTTQVPAIGDSVGYNQWFSGSMGFAAIYAAALTAAQHAQIASICRQYYKAALS